MDNRPEAFAQRKLQEISRKSNPEPLQLKTVIKHTTNNFKYGPGNSKNETVGVEMEAWLDPKDKIIGSEPDGQESLMNSLRKATGISGTGLVRGHLLNHDLGGFGVPQNLYPITGGANGAHKGFAENPVGKLLTDANTANNQTGVYYKVKVAPQLTETDFKNKPSKFICTAKNLTGVTPTSKGSISGGDHINRTIVSDPKKTTTNSQGEKASYWTEATDSSLPTTTYTKIKYVAPGWDHDGKGDRNGEFTAATLPGGKIEVFSLYCCSWNTRHT